MQMLCRDNRNNIWTIKSSNIGNYQTHIGILHDKNYLCAKASLFQSCEINRPIFGDTSLNLDP